MAEQSAYLGNPNLKKANDDTEFTPEHVQEVIKCANNPVYFIRNYIKIVSLDEGVIPFKMYDFQEKMVMSFHENRFNIAKLPRQSGKSTIVTAYLLWYVIFNDNVNVAILANKAATAREMLGRLQLSYENLPKWMQQGIIGGTKGQWNWRMEVNSWHLLLLLPSGVCLLMLYFWTNSRLYRIISRISSLLCLSYYFVW